MIDSKKEIWEEDSFDIDHTDDTVQVDLGIPEDGIVAESIHEEI